MPRAGLQLDSRTARNAESMRLCEYRPFRPRVEFHKRREFRTLWNSSLLKCPFFAHVDIDGMASPADGASERGESLSGEFA